MPSGVSLTFDQHNRPFHCFQLPCSSLLLEGLKADPRALAAWGWGALGLENCCPDYLKQLLGSFQIGSSFYQKLQR